MPQVLRASITMAWAVAAALAGMALPAAERLQQPERPVFRSRTDLVTVIATVTDRRGTRVGNLQQGDFQVMEEGRAQEIALFSADEDIPISVALVVDTSGSMTDKLEDVADALTHFIQRTRPDDQLFLIRFSDGAELVGEYTDDERRSLERAVRRLYAQGGTALNDAVLRGVDVLRAARHRKRTLILITDGNDTASQASEREAADAARSAELLVYALGIGHRGGFSFGHGSLGHQDRVDISTLKRLAEPSGGRAFLLEDAHRGGRDLVDEAVVEIGNELRQQYSIGYYPKNPAKPGEFRRIKLTVRDPSLKVRAREGYRVPAR